MGHLIFSAILNFSLPEETGSGGECHETSWSSMKTLYSSLDFQKFNNFIKQCSEIDNMNHELSEGSSRPAGWSTWSK